MTENITTCMMCQTCHHKKAGRRPKYKTDEERKKAKQEQTNVCLQKREEALINFVLDKLN